MEKYPRTFHLPWSPGATSDDKMLSPEEVSNFIGKRIIITEKLDGQNSCLTHNGVYARSHTDFTHNPWDSYLWDLQKIVKDLISEDEKVFGESLYAIHSIEYNKLTSYFHIFNICNNERWYSWKEIDEFSEILVINNWDLEFQTVPPLFDGVMNLVDELKSFIDNTMKLPSKYGDTKEGVVIRNHDSFPIDEFRFNVCKYVRANHVQTDQHWSRNWRKAKLVLDSPLH